MNGNESLRFAIPTTIVCEPGLVRLLAGEDFRFTLRGPELESWLPGLLERLDGQTKLDAVLQGLDQARRTEALTLLDRLVGERLLFAAETLPQAFQAVVQAEGSGALFDCVQGLQPASTAPGRVRVLCQDTLDYAAALRFNQACRAGQDPWLWATLGPNARAFISPVFWPDVGPCVSCLLDGFKRLSPAPELYGALALHAERGGVFAAAAFPAHGTAIVANLIHWKVATLAAAEPSPAVTRLHVVEVGTMGVESHRIPRDLECAVCSGDLQVGSD